MQQHGDMSGKKYVLFVLCNVQGMNKRERSGKQRLWLEILKTNVYSLSRQELEKINTTLMFME